MIRYEVAEHKVVFDRSQSGIGERGLRHHTLEADEPKTHRLHIFVDRSVVELYVNDGETVMSGYDFAQSTSQAISLFALGGSAKIVSLELWKLVG